MASRRASAAARTVRILWGSTHPGPTVVVTGIALALGVAAALPIERLAVLALSVFLGQISIGLSNDVIDAPRDRVVGRHDKPLARPGAPVRAGFVTAVASAVLALALSAVLSWQLAVAHAVFLGCGWAYNAVLKRTFWSAACFAVGFGVFPSLPPLSLEAPHVAAPYAWVAGAALGVAVHFSNVLPDLEDDVRTGVRGLPHRIGRTGSAVVAFAALIVGAVVCLWGPVVETGRAPDAAAWVCAALVLIVALWGAGVSLSRPPTRLSFRLVMLAALLLTLQLVIATWAQG